MDRYLRHTGTPGQLLDVDKQDKVAQVTPVIRAGGRTGNEKFEIKAGIPAWRTPDVCYCCDANVRSRIAGGPLTKEDLAKNNKLFIELASKACEYERE